MSAGADVAAVGVQTGIPLDWIVLGRIALL